MRLMKLERSRDDSFCTISSCFSKAWIFSILVRKVNLVVMYTIITIRNMSVGSQCRAKKSLEITCPRKSFLARPHRPVEPVAEVFFFPLPVAMILQDKSTVYKCFSVSEFYGYAEFG